MKYIVQILSPLFLISITISACRKDEVVLMPLSGLNITNVVVGGSSVKMSSSNITVAYGASNSNFTIVAGDSKIYIYPVGDSLKPYFNQAVKAGSGEVFSLFLAGQAPAIDAMLIKESIPYRTDSTIGVRFINLSPNSPEVKVTLSTSTTVNEFVNIPYKGITDFKSYSALSTNISYVFQVRNAATNTLIASITLSGTSLATGMPRFKNVTLVLRGLVGSAPAAGITRVNHY